MTISVSGWSRMFYLIKNFAFSVGPAFQTLLSWTCLVLGRYTTWYNVPNSCAVKSSSFYTNLFDFSLLPECIFQLEFQNNVHYNTYFSAYTHRPTVNTRCDVIFIPLKVFCNNLGLASPILSVIDQRLCNEEILRGTHPDTPVMWNYHFICRSSSMYFQCFDS